MSTGHDPSDGLCYCPECLHDRDCPKKERIKDLEFMNRHLADALAHVINDLEDHHEVCEVAKIEAENAIHEHIRDQGGRI